MMHRFKMIRCYFVILFCFAIAGCGTTNDPTRFYSLQPNMGSKSKSGSDTAISLGVASIRIPRLLDRSQIVSRINDHEIIRSEFHQWAGSVEDEIEKFFVSELENSLDKAYIPVLPSNAKQKPTQGLYITILRFDGTLGENVVLKLNWQLIDRVTRSNVQLGTFRIELPLNDSSYSSYVAGLSRLIRHSATHIADQITSNRQ